MRLKKFILTREMFIFAPIRSGLIIQVLMCTCSPS